MGLPVGRTGLKGVRMEGNGELYGGQVEEGVDYDLRVDAKGINGEGIGRLGRIVVFVKDGKTRVGNTYKVKVTKMYRTFCNAQLVEQKSKPIVGDVTLMLK